MYLIVWNLSCRIQLTIDYAVLQSRPWWDIGERWSKTMKIMATATKPRIQRLKKILTTTMDEKRDENLC